MHHVLSHAESVRSLAGASCQYRSAMQAGRREAHTVAAVRLMQAEEIPGRVMHQHSESAPRESAWARSLVSPPRRAIASSG
jgi:hypothetical protein